MERLPSKWMRCGNYIAGMGREQNLETKGDAGANAARLQWPEMDVLNATPMRLNYFRGKSLSMRSAATARIPSAS